MLFPSTCINMLGNLLSCEISKLGHPLVLPGSKKGSSWARVKQGESKNPIEYLLYKQQSSYHVWKVAFVVTVLGYRKIQLQGHKNTEHCPKSPELIEYSRDIS